MPPPATTFKRPARQHFVGLLHTWLISLPLVALMALDAGQDPLPFVSGIAIGQAIFAVIWGVRDRRSGGFVVQAGWLLPRNIRSGELPWQRRRGVYLPAFCELRARRWWRFATYKLIGTHGGSVPLIPLMNVDLPGLRDPAIDDVVEAIRSQLATPPAADTPP